MRIFNINSCAFAQKSGPLQVILCFAFAVLTRVAPAAAAEPSSHFVLSRLDIRFLEQIQALDRSLERDGLIYLDDAVQKYITRVGESIISKRPPPERVNWQFRVLRDPLPNAFSLPNGTIYVHTGLLSLLENDQQLAGVLAHEADHVRNRDGYRLFRSYRKKSVVVSVINAATVAAPYAGAAAEAGAAVVTGLQVAGNLVPIILVATYLGYSRDLERQADIGAIGAMTVAGYDAREFVRCLHLLEAAPDSESPKIFYADHPRLEERIQDLETQIQVRNTARSFVVGAAAHMNYLTTMEGVIRHNISLSILTYRSTSALVLGRKLVEFNPASSDNAYMVAEAYRALGPIVPGGGSGLNYQKKILGNKKLLPEEKRREIMATAEGRSAWQQNQHNAEQFYRRALELSPQNWKASWGLGQLFEEAGQEDRALEAYRKCLEASPDSERDRIQRRIQKLTRTSLPPRTLTIPLQPKEGQP